MLLRTILYIFAVILITGLLPLKNTQSFGERKDWRKRSEENTEKIVNFTFLDTLNHGKEVSLFDDDSNIKNVNTDDEIPEKKKIKENGYRIQLVASNSEEKIRSEQISAEQELRLKTYIIFEKPYYKVFAGDFITREDAEKAITKIKKSGYPKAWIVKSDILVSN